MTDTGQHGKWRVRNRTGTLLHGSGQKESVYQNALEEKLMREDIPFQREIGISIHSEDTGKILGSHRMDFVVDGKVVVETKAIKFTPGYHVGLMVNFGSSKLYIRRIILT